MKRKIKFIKFILVSVLSTVMGSAMGATPGTAPGDMLYERKDNSDIASFPPSIFPHWVHRIHYRCDACHDTLFEMKSGGTTVTMDLMKKGKVCGACHNGELAFAASLSNCNRCHVSIEE